MFEWLFGSSLIQKVVIKHDGKTYRLTFEKEDYTDKSVLLSTLKSKLAPLVDVPAENLTVYTTVPKRKLSNDQKTLASYKVRNEDTLLVVGEKPKPLTASDHIAAAVAEVEGNLGSRITEFCENPPTSEAVRNKEFLFLNEIILQNILKLDNVETEGDQEVRQERKGAINKLQKYHSSIDAANKRSLELIKDAAAAGAAGAGGAAGADGGAAAAPASGGSKKKKKSKGKKR